jgi:hypothetical protein
VPRTTHGSKKPREMPPREPLKTRKRSSGQGTPPRARCWRRPKTIRTRLRASSARALRRLCAPAVSRKSLDAGQPSLPEMRGCSRPPRTSWLARNPDPADQPQREEVRPDLERCNNNNNGPRHRNPPRPEGEATQANGHLRSLRSQSFLRSQRTDRENPLRPDQSFRPRRPLHNIPRLTSGHSRLLKTDLCSARSSRPDRPRKRRGLQLRIDRFPSRSETQNSPLDRREQCPAPSPSLVPRSGPRLPGKLPRRINQDLMGVLLTSIMRRFRSFPVQVEIPLTPISLRQTFERPSRLPRLQLDYLSPLLLVERG